MSQTRLFHFPDGKIGIWSRGPGVKKYRVVLYKNRTDYKNQNKWKTVTFGDKRYQQWRDNSPMRLYKHLNHNDPDRRRNYRNRHGAQGYQKKKYTPAWFSWHYLW